MKLLTQGSRLQRCMGALLLCLVGMAAPAAAQSDQLDGSFQRLEADVRAVARARHGQWIELPTGGWSTRQFVQELYRRNNDNSVLVQLRVDYIGPASDGAASQVQTVWLYCDAGMRRVVVNREYDMQGKQVLSTETPDAPAERIKNLYAGTEQLICSEQYLLLEVADGYQRLGDMLLLRKRLRALRVSERSIPNL